jgi:uncharacterized membrane protein
MIQSPLYAVLLAAFVAQPALSRALSEIDDSASTLSTKGVSNVSFPVFHIPLTPAATHVWLHAAQLYNSLDDLGAATFARVAQDH